jgi:hypothetical protein
VDQGRIEADLMREHYLSARSITILEAQPLAASSSLERRAGIEPANTGFADLRVDRFATGA